MHTVSTVGCVLEGSATVHLDLEGCTAKRVSLYKLRITVCVQYVYTFKVCKYKPVSCTERRGYYAQCHVVHTLSHRAESVRLWLLSQLGELYQWNMHLPR